MNWTDICKILKDAPNEALLDILKGLYNLSPQNKAFIRTQLLPGRQDKELLEKSRKQVIRAIYADTKGIPHMPRFGESRKAIRTYQKATGDVAGTLDLMLLHVERGTQFTNDFGDIDEPFYEGLELMLDDFRDLLLANPHLYKAGDLSLRLPCLAQAAGWMGWGYGDYVTEQVSKIMQHFGDV